MAVVSMLELAGLKVKPLYEYSTLLNLDIRVC